MVPATFSFGKYIPMIMYLYLHMILIQLLTTSSELTIKSDLYDISLAGIRNPLVLGLVFWLLWKIKSGQLSLPQAAIDWSIVAMALATVLSLSLSTHPLVSFQYLLTSLLFIGFFYFCRDLIDTRERLQHIVYAVLFTGIVVVTFNIHYLYQNNFCTLGVLERYPFWTEKSPMGFYNTFILTFILGLLLSGWKSARLSVNIILVLLTIGATISLFFSFSRSSWLTALVIIFLAGVLRYGRSFFIVSLVLVLVLSFLMSGIVKEITLAIYHINSGNVDDRVYIWKSSLDMLRDNPLSGIGAGTFNLNYLQWYQLLESKRWNASYHAHNLFLHTAAEQGYIGLIALLFFWGVIFRQIVNNFALFRNSNDTLLRGVNLAVTLGLVNYVLWSLTNTSISNVTKSFFNINLLTWFLAALVFCCPAIYKQNPSESSICRNE